MEGGPRPDRAAAGAHDGPGPRSRRTMGSLVGRTRATLAGGWHDVGSVVRRVVVPVGQGTAAARAVVRAWLRALRRGR